MKFNLLIAIAVFIFLDPSQLVAQSPRNPNNDIAAINNFQVGITVAQIEANFNNARRQEETQLGLATNAIQNLDLPDQATWNGYSDDQKMLFLLNDERTSRAGVNYGDGACKGLPFEGVETNVDQIAQAYAQFLIDNNTFGHDLNGDFDVKLNNNGTIGGAGCNNNMAGTVANCCHQNLPRGENLYSSSSTNNDITTPVEASVYGWNYEDAGEGWGHREMNLLQDDDLPWSPGNLWGFLDDNGDPGKAGMIGVGVAVTTTNPGGFPFRKVVVLNYFDPAPNCNFNLLVDTDDLGGGGGGCTITAIAAGNQSACDVNTNTYTQQVTITFANAPAMGNLVVHGQNFAIGTSPQTVTLVGLTANGQPVNVTANFSAQPGCTFTQNNAFTAPAACNGGGGCNAIAINCGQNYNGNTNTGMNNFSMYNCVNWDETGNEIVYQITTTAIGDITATVSNDNDGDLDVFILTACNNTSCIAFGDVTAMATNQAAGTYLIVVDGFDGASSSFSLVVNANCGGGNCNTPPPAMGPIAAGTYQIAGDMTSAGTVANPDNVIFKSGSSITLSANFEVAAGATFEALIEACNGPEQPLNFQLEGGTLSGDRDKTLKIIPNPATGQRNLRYQVGQTGPVNLAIFDLNGQMVLQLIDNSMRHPGTYDIAVPSDKVPAGIYSVLISTSQATVTKRLVLTR